MKAIKILLLRFSKKMLEARKKGLYQYRNYLFNQLEYASRSDLRSAYKRYVEDQVKLNDSQLKRIDDKLNLMAGA